MTVYVDWRNWISYMLNMLNCVYVYVIKELSDLNILGKIPAVAEQCPNVSI